MAWLVLVVAEEEEGCGLEECEPVEDGVDIDCSAMGFAASRGGDLSFAGAVVFEDAPDLAGEQGSVLEMEGLGFEGIDSNGGLLVSRFM